MDRDIPVAPGVSLGKFWHVEQRIGGRAHRYWRALFDCPEGTIKVGSRLLPVFMYTCPECGYASEENGKCPACDVTMVRSDEGEVEEEDKEED